MALQLASCLIAEEDRIKGFMKLFVEFFCVCGPESGEIGDEF
jgi:hypothetical protein